MYDMYDMDIAAVRRAYHHPTIQSPPTRLPTTEELMAQYERESYDWCVGRGIDPAKIPVGVEERLIGGFSKPMRRRDWDWFYGVSLEPMPLEWYDYPLAHIERGSTEHFEETLFVMIKSHFAGSAQQPDVADMVDWFHGRNLTSEGAYLLKILLQSLHFGDTDCLLDAGTSVFAMARATHISKTRYYTHVNWLNQFARDPEMAAEYRAMDEEHRRLYPRIFRQAHGAEAMSMRL